MQLRRQRREPETSSLQEPIESARDGAALTVEDTVQDDACMEADCEHRDEARRLRAQVERLNGRERQILVLRYGLGGQPPQTQEEAARILGISRSYVSRLETRALAQLRGQVRKES